jgi:hypothetical protein
VLALTWTSGSHSATLATPPWATNWAWMGAADAPDWNMHWAASYTTGAELSVLGGLTPTQIGLNFDNPDPVGHPDHFRDVLGLSGRDVRRTDVHHAARHDRGARTGHADHARHGTSRHRDREAQAAVAAGRGQATLFQRVSSRGTSAFLSGW